MVLSMCLKFIIIVIALIMAIIQFSYLTSNYQNKEVINDLHLKVPDYVKVPSVTVCASYPSLIDFKKLAAQYPDFVKELQRENSVNAETYPNFIRGNGQIVMKRMMKNQFTVKELMSVSYTEDEFLQIIFVPSPTTSDIIADKREINKRCRRTMFLKDSKTCITFNCFKESENKFNFDDVIEGRAKGSLLALRFNQSLFEKMLSIAVLVHSPDTLPRGLRQQTMNVASGPDALVNPFSYRKYEYHLLPYPYASNCKNYSDDGYESQLHTIEDCENRRSKKKFGYPFPQNIRFSNDTHLIEPDNEKFANASMKIRESCQQKHSQRDCILEDFIPVQYPTVKLGLNYNTLLLKISREPDVVKTSIPKSSFINYISSVCGTLAFWYIVAILGILLVSRFVGDKQKKNEPKYINNNNNNNNNYSNATSTPKKLSFSHEPESGKSRV